MKRKIILSKFRGIKFFLQEIRQKAFKEGIYRLYQKPASRERRPEQENGNRDISAI